MKFRYTDLVDCVSLVVVENNEANKETDQNNICIVVLEQLINRVCFI